MTRTETLIREYHLSETETSVLNEILANNYKTEAAREATGEPEVFFDVMSGDLWRLSDTARSALSEEELSVIRKVCIDPEGHTELSLLLAENPSTRPSM